MPSPRPTVWDLCQEQVARRRAHPTCHASPTDAAVRRHLAHTSLAATPAREATADQFNRLLHGLTIAGHGVAARWLYVHLHAAYAHAPFIKVNPLAMIEGGAWFDPPSDDGLTWAEFAAIWCYLDNDGEAAPSIARRFVRLSLLLFGQCCQQLLRAQVTDVDLERGQLRLWDRRGHGTGPRLHLLPAGPAATVELRRLVQQAEDLGVLTLFPSGPPQRRLRPLDAGAVHRDVRATSTKLQQQGHVNRHFGYRELLWTLELSGAQLGINADVRASLRSRVTKGIQHKFYRYSYLEDKHEALVMWEDYLVSLAPPPSRKMPRAGVTVAVNRGST